jgi:hypothetical protein
MKPIHCASTVMVILAALGAGCDRSEATPRGHVAQYGRDGGYGTPNPMPGSPIADAAPTPTIPAPKPPGSPPVPGAPTTPGAPPTNPPGTPTVPGAPPPGAPTGPTTPY